MILSAKSISKTFHKTGSELKIIDSASIDVCGGDFISIEGRSGCGKSTLLLMLGGLLSPDKGNIHFKGKDLYSMSSAERAATMNSGIGFVFQQFHLLPFLSVRENILTASIPSTGSASHEKADNLMRKLGIDSRSSHLPSELSVGERQRTALARALLNNPSIILADEPTGNLDAENSEIILRCFAEFAENGGAVLLVTHDPESIKYAKARYGLCEGSLVKK